MRYFKSDWMRWSLAEKIVAVALVVTSITIYGSSIVSSLSG